MIIRPATIAKPCCYFISLLLACGLTSATHAASTEAGDSSSALKLREFVFESASFPSCHASTIVQAGDGSLLTAFFGGQHEGASDVGIWISRKLRSNWSAPIQIATGVDSDGKPVPTWNPVLFLPAKGSLCLFYKAGPSPAKWWGMMMTSNDSGATWSKPHRLPDGILGPIKNKPIQLSGGALLCPSSDESDGWKLHIEFTTDLGLTWSRTAALNEGHNVRQIQPALLDHGHGVIQLLSRTDQGRIYQSWSHDNGKHWDPTSPTDLPNPNSGIDAVQLTDGRSLLVYNPSPRDRLPLSFSISKEGRLWSKPIMIDDSGVTELSYPAVIQTTDGNVHITYTWGRKRICHAVIDPSMLR